MEECRQTNNVHSNYRLQGTSWHQRGEGIYKHRVTASTPSTEVSYYDH